MPLHSSSPTSSASHSLITSVLLSVSVSKCVISALWVWIITEHEITKVLQYWVCIPAFFLWPGPSPPSSLSDCSHFLATGKCSYQHLFTNTWFCFQCLWVCPRNGIYCLYSDPVFERSGQRLFYRGATIYQHMRVQVFHTVTNTWYFCCCVQ